MAMKLIQGISGIGPSAATKLVENGARTIEDLRKMKHELNHHQIIGLKYYEEFNHRIPREEVIKLETIAKSIITQVDRSLISITCGSYRRGAPTCGDIDILVTHPEYTKSSKDPNYLSRIVNKLHGIKFLTDDLSMGKKKYMGVCKLEDEGDVRYIHRRVDIRMIPHENFYCGLLYFTGSDFFNNQMRIRAQEKGYTLNEYELCPLGEDGKKGKPLPVASEKDVFDYLGMEYKVPEERNV
eukprot:TRINITY_DN21732_c0_g1_i1.p2 TRINITY_DN21732_c0_g1~~TRINITY_DN21732_c0_g1_i1.p2  ORF type:complete len:240 (-),score=35.40 TRINITY_DN21732_c0_g1_i1:54-773(-)